MSLDCMAGRWNDGDGSIGFYNETGSRWGIGYGVPARQFITFKPLSVDITVLQDIVMDKGIPRDVLQKLNEL